MATKIRVAYLIIETREFEVKQDISNKNVGEVLEICEFDIGFDEGKVVDREVLRENMVADDLPWSGSK
jgi:hypothetical protein